MIFARSWKRPALPLLVATLLGGCAQHGVVLPPTALSATSVAPAAVPPDCEGQKTTKNYATLTETLKTKAGTLCIPAFGGFGGTINYPGANPSQQLTLTSNIKDYDHQPKLGSGTPVFYLQLAISGATSFGNKVPPGGGLTGAKLGLGKPYTVFGQAVIYNIPFNLKPCYTIATKGPYGGVIGGVGTLLKGESVPAAATGVIEIYAGKQAHTKC